MEGCLSTLEAIALALKVLEPSDAISTALLDGFRAMVALQTQCMARGRQQALEKHGGVSKREAIAQRQQQQKVTSDSEQTARSTNSTASAAPLSLVREYVFYTTHVDFRQRKQLVQQVCHSECGDCQVRTASHSHSLAACCPGRERQVHVRPSARAVPSAQRQSQARRAPRVPLARRVHAAE